MKVIELFAGTKSISKAFERAGIRSYSVEFDHQHPNIDWYADINDITAKDLVKRFGVPDVLWASPPCQSYSVAAIGHHRMKNEDGFLIPKTEFAKASDRLLAHTLEIIRDLLEINPHMIWFIENPRCWYEEVIHNVPFEERQTHNHILQVRGQQDETHGHLDELSQSEVHRTL